jgi:hypothetical protein
MPFDDYDKYVVEDELSPDILGMYVDKWIDSVCPYPLSIDIIPKGFLVEVRICRIDVPYDVYGTSSIKREYIKIVCPRLSFYYRAPDMKLVNNVMLKALLLLIIEPSKEHLDYFNKTLPLLLDFDDFTQLQTAIRDSLKHSTLMNHDYYKACVETYKDEEFIISLIGEFIRDDRKSKLIPIIETVDPEKTLEYYTKHDIEKVPILIELFNQYGKYEELTL